MGFSPAIEEGFVQGARAFGLDLGPRELGAFYLYYQELSRWGLRMNLTALEGEEAVVQQGFLDSLALAKAFDFSTGPKAIDLGSGAGFPALPLKICFPQLPYTLVDSNHKKYSFLKHVSRLLGLTQIEILWTRAELLAEKARFRGAFDVVTARALGSLGEVGAQAYPFLRNLGLLLAPRGNQEEALPLKGFNPPQSLAYRLPGEERGRQILIFEKTSIIK